MASQPLRLTRTPPSLHSSSSSSSSSYLPTFHHHHHHTHTLFCNGAAFTRLYHRRTSPTLSLVPSVGKEDTDLRVSSQQEQQQDDEPSPQDLEYVAQIKKVLELLRKNRDMLFGEVKLTIMIEDPREVERRKLLGIEDLDAPTRDDLVAALEEVNEGKIPKNRVALQMLAKELASWPNIKMPSLTPYFSDGNKREVLHYVIAEAPKKKPSKSLYAKATDTGIDPQMAAKKLNVDWDSAAEIEDTDVDDDTEVPPAVGYGALYLVTAFPVIIGISVVLILFYNSLQ